MGEQEGQQTMDAENAKLGDGAPSEGEPIPEPIAQPAGEPTGDGTPAPTVPVEPTYDIDGEKFTAAQIKEFRAGHMKAADYSQKTQKLADDRRDYERDKTDLGAYQDSIDYINGNPELRDQVNQLLNDHYSGGKEPGNENKNLPTNEMPGWAKNQQRDIEDMRLDRSLDKLKANPQFKDKITAENEKELLRYAFDNKIGDLTIAAQSYFYSQGTAEAKMAGAQEVTDGIQKKADVTPPIGSGDGMATAPAEDPKKMNMNQIFEGPVADDLFK